VEQNDARVAWFSSSAAARVVKSTFGLRPYNPGAAVRRVRARYGLSAGESRRAVGSDVNGRWAPRSP